MNKEIDQRNRQEEDQESAIELAVPLEADENEGKTWYEAK